MFHRRSDARCKWFDSLHHDQRIACDVGQATVGVSGNGLDGGSGGFGGGRGLFWSGGIVERRGDCEEEKASWFSHCFDPVVG